MTAQTLPNIDVLDSEFIDQALSTPGPWVSIFLPTYRTGRETLMARDQFSNLLGLAEKQLDEAGHEDIDGLLGQARELTENWNFWQNQSDGLAVYAAPGVFRTFRLPTALPDEAHVGDEPRFHPIAQLLSDRGTFYVLALASNSVRLLEGTRASVGELDLADAPESVDDLSGDRDPQAQLQHSPQSRGGNIVNFHGHGGDDPSEQNVERFFRAVASSVDAIMGRTVAHPLVLATVDANQAVYRRVSNHRRPLDEVVSGNPEHLSPRDLHEKAWPIVREFARQADHELAERYGALIGTGKASADVALIGKAAQEGRVDVLILGPQPTVPDGQANLVEDPVDELIAHTLRNSGSIVVVDDEEAPEVRAIFRY